MLFARIVLIVSLLLGFEGALHAKTYYLPDYQKAFIYGGRVSEDDTGHNTSKPSCSNFSYYSAANRPAGLNCELIKPNPSPGLECYSCGCSDDYRYNSSNCSEDYILSDKCGDNYKNCICNSALYPASSSGEGCPAGKKADLGASCHNKSDSNIVYKCIDDPCYDLISKNSCSGYCRASTICANKCESCDNDTCSWPENEKYSSCDEGCDGNGAVDGCPSKCKTGCKAKTCPEGQKLSGDSCVQMTCEEYVIAKGYTPVTTADELRTAMSEGKEAVLMNNLSPSEDVTVTNNIYAPSYFASTNSACTTDKVTLTVADNIILDDTVSKEIHLYPFVNNGNDVLIKKADMSVHFHGGVYMNYLWHNNTALYFYTGSNSLDNEYTQSSGDSLRLYVKNTGTNFYFNGLEVGGSGVPFVLSLDKGACVKDGNDNGYQVCAASATTINTQHLSGQNGLWLPLSCGSKDTNRNVSCSGAITTNCPEGTVPMAQNTVGSVYNSYTFPSKTLYCPIGWYTGSVTTNKCPTGYYSSAYANPGCTGCYNSSSTTPHPYYVEAGFEMKTVCVKNRSCNQWLTDAKPTCQIIDTAADFNKKSCNVIQDRTLGTINLTKDFDDEISIYSPSFFHVQSGGACPLVDYSLKASNLNISNMSNSLNIYTELNVNNTMEVSNNTIILNKPANIYHLSGSENAYLEAHAGLEIEDTDDYRGNFDLYADGGVSEYALNTDLYVRNIFVNEGVELSIGSTCPNCSLNISKDACAKNGTYSVCATSSVKSTVLADVNPLPAKCPITGNSYYPTCTGTAEFTCLNGAEMRYDIYGRVTCPTGCASKYWLVSTADELKVAASNGGEGAVVYLTKNITVDELKVQGDLFEIHSASEVCADEGYVQATLNINKLETTRTTVKIYTPTDIGQLYCWDSGGYGYDLNLYNSSMLINEIYIYGEDPYTSFKVYNGRLEVDEITMATDNPLDGLNQLYIFEADDSDIILNTNNLACGTYEVGDLRVQLKAQNNSTIKTSGICSTYFYYNSADSTSSIR